MKADFSFISVENVCHAEGSRNQRFPGGRVAPPLFAGHIETTALDANRKLHDSLGRGLDTLLAIARSYSTTIKNINPWWLSRSSVLCETVSKPPMKCKQKMKNIPIICGFDTAAESIAAYSTTGVCMNVTENNYE